MKEVVLAAPVRTAIGTFNGSLASLTAAQMGAVVLAETIKRGGIKVDDVDEVIMGNVLNAGMGQNPVRQAAIHAGLPVSVPAYGVSKVCGSGLKAVMLAAQSIALGDAEVVLAGGTESMSNAAYALMKARWENEKKAIGQVGRLREELEALHQEIAKAEWEYDLNRAAELKYGKLPELEKRLHEAEKGIRDGKDGESLLREEVVEEEIARIISQWTGIPLTRLMEGEREKLLRLSQVLHERVVGQEEAVDSVSDAILRARAGIKDPRRPIGSFLFLGPTGVGKTELAKTLALSLFDSQENMVRIDMSEYMEKHAVSRLVGAPPGYVGYEEGGQLTEAVRRHPYCVLLFDEIEKAHPDVFHILLQVLDDGRITDSQGRTVDFKNTIIIMTSNIGSGYLLEGIREEGEISPAHRSQVMEELSRSFRPEFLNRLDEIILFRPLSRQEIGSIVHLLLAELEERLREQGITLALSQEAVDFLAQGGYDPLYGARPLRRYLQHQVENPLARGLIAGDFQEGADLYGELHQGALHFRDRGAEGKLQQ